MISNEIKQFIADINNSIDGAVKLAQDDFKTRLEGIESFNSYSPELRQMLNISSVIHGSVNEMKQLQAKQNKIIESEIYKVDNKLTSLMNEPDKHADEIILLSNRLPNWINRLKDIEIPKSSSSNGYPNNINSNIKQLIDKWNQICINDPIIKKAKLREKKLELEKEISVVLKKITEIENNLNNLQIDYQDRKNNSSKYEKQVETEIREEVAEIDIELNHAMEDVTDLETQKNSIQKQLSSSSVFAFGKKKELKLEIIKIDEEISHAKENVSTIQKKKKDIIDSLPNRIKQLENTISLLNSRILESEQKLSSNKVILAKKQKDLAEINAEL